MPISIVFGLTLSRIEPKSAISAVSLYHFTTDRLNIVVLTRELNPQNGDYC